MNALDHIAVLRMEVDNQEAFSRDLEVFSDQYHKAMIQYFEAEWAGLLLAETPNEKKAALDILQIRYEKLKVQT